MDLKDLKLGIVGNGVVGAATASAWAGHVKEVLAWDVRPERANCSFADVMGADLVMVCLPTPQRAGSLECDTDALVSFFESLSVEQRQANMVIRSTIPIGFTRATAKAMLCRNVVHSPEFLTARTAEHDAANPTRNIVGVPGGWDSSVVNQPLYRAYRQRWPNVDIYHMTSDESEAVKLAQNAFSAVKIAWFNELHELCVHARISFSQVREALLAGGWINPMHTQVPGPDGLGFSGACLPKDLASFCRCCLDAGTLPHVSLSARERNELDRRR